MLAWLGKQAKGTLRQLDGSYLKLHQHGPPRSQKAPPAGGHLCAANISAIAAQVVILCLLSYLLVLFETGLAEASMVNQAEEKRRKKVPKARTARVEKTGRKISLIIAGFQQLILRERYAALWVQRRHRSLMPPCPLWQAYFHAEEPAGSLRGGVERAAGDATFVQGEVFHGAVAGQGLAEMP